MALESAAASTAGLFDTHGGEHAGWRLLVVIATESRGERRWQRKAWTCNDGGDVLLSGTRALVAGGDFISWKSNVVSFLNQETLAHMTLRNAGAPELPGRIQQSGSDIPTLQKWDILTLRLQPASSIR
ncbi:hypothetical protein ACVDG5_018525 [Mesorhizobium sp. ORM6]